jgi:hypothetical protein
MINLISQQSKKKIATQYFWRLGTVTALIVGAFLFLGTALLIPSYFIANEKENTEVFRAAELQNNKEFQENKELGKLVENTNKQLERFDSIQSFAISHQLIQPVLDHVYEDETDIQLDTINYRVDEGVALVDIEGSAKTRDDLLRFVENLKADELFTKVDVPVSSFVKNIDISFQITLHSMLESL